MDYSYFTDPVSCEVSNSVGSTNVSTLVDVQCEFNLRLTLWTLWPDGVFSDFLEVYVLVKAAAH